MKKLFYSFILFICLMFGISTTMSSCRGSKATPSDSDSISVDSLDSDSVDASGNTVALNNWAAIHAIHAVTHDNESNSTSTESETTESHESEPVESHSVEKAPCESHVCIR